MINFVVKLMAGLITYPVSRVYIKYKRRMLIQNQIRLTWGALLHTLRYFEGKQQTVKVNTSYFREGFFVLYRACFSLRSKPIFRFVFSGGAIKARKASKTTLN